MIKKTLLAFLALNAAFSAHADINLNNNISDKYPFIASGTGVLAESSEHLWIKFDDETFKKATKFTTSNNYRREHNALKVEAFGVKSEKYKFTKNPKLKEYWVEANTIASNAIEGKSVDVYCTSVTTSGMPSCIIFSNLVNGYNEEIRMNYNRAIIESGLSVFEYDPETIQLGSMEKTVIYAQETAKKNGVGVWSHSLGILDIQFE